MHFYTLHELKKMGINGQEKISRVVPEQSVLLNGKNIAGAKEGKFDFLVELAGSGSIGIEVLTRPSKGKMREKLGYAEQVQKFVFVIPEKCLEFYRKPKFRMFRRLSRDKFFDDAFSRDNLFVWLFDTEQRKFVDKGKFSNVFNVQKQ